MLRGSGCKRKHTIARGYNYKRTRLHGQSGTETDVLALNCVGQQIVWRIFAIIIVHSHGEFPDLGTLLKEFLPLLTNFQSRMA